MLTRRWLLAIPLAILTTAGAATASEVRDRARLFSPEAVRAAEAQLNRIEQATGAPTIIETIKTLGDQPVQRVAVQHAEASGLHRGVYVLIAKDETKIKALDKLNLGAERRQQIERAFTTSFRKRDFDAGLTQGTQTIGDVLTSAKASAPPAARRGLGRGPNRPAVIPPAPAPRGGGGWGILLIIGLVIVAVLIGIRLLGSLFSGAGRGYAGGPMPGPGGAPPGYGGPGYGGGYGGGGGRGGFLSSLFGGLGGAMAGNWLYDQMSHRHHDQPIQTGDPTAGSYGAEPVAPEPAEWGGANEPGGDWGGGDTGGGTDWSGGDVASGGDWGGGGGGGDWGGGGGGGDDWS